MRLLDVHDLGKKKHIMRIFPSMPTNFTWTLDMKR